MTAASASLMVKIGPIYNDKPDHFALPYLCPLDSIPTFFLVARILHISEMRLDRC
jgi:hypothetical protein